MIALACALAAGAGAHLLWSAAGTGTRDQAPTASHDTQALRRLTRAPGGAPLMERLGWTELPRRELLAGAVVVGAAGFFMGVALFGGLLPGAACGGFAATTPVSAAAAKRRLRREAALDAWPRLLEELRVQTSALGRSIPQALFEVGRRAPTELRPAFEAAQREWLLSTDFDRTLTVLKRGLADPTADATAETLLVAHELGGADLDRRLTMLIEDRTIDVRGRKDARAKQAGVRFTRRFVLLVPLGMALAGMSVGNGRAAYTTPIGQVLVVAGLAVVGVCWWWASHFLRLPSEPRVFDAQEPAR